MIYPTDEEHVIQAQTEPLCPACGSVELTGSEVYIEGSACYQDCGCSDCGTTWTDVYTLAGYSNLTDGRIKR